MNKEVLQHWALDIGRWTPACRQASSIFDIKKGIVANNPFQIFLQINLLSQVYHFYPRVFVLIKYKKIIRQVNTTVHGVYGIHHHIARFI